MILGTWNDIKISAVD